ncbi:hypothetical protein [Paenibacillus sp. MSJ-6]|uniref:LexA repressor DNA-binding domain-containing protein n=1 Tax=Paenibacillus brevis TaxID=2841508 RepID=A0ABS6FJ87_9BACL|nr:hypothetical protein [Paenibacillus brevis]
MNPAPRRSTDFIKSFVGRKGYPPTVREIAEHMHYQCILHV